MTSHYRAVVIGGGIVGCSVLYHLARAGWRDVVLVERAELTAGSTWHAAAGFHAMNSDPNIAALQAYTIRLYGEIERESGQNVGMHMTGGLSLAGTGERWDWLKAEHARFIGMGMNTRLVGRDEMMALCPIIDPEGIAGALWDADEGYVDAHGATHAFAAAARKHGAEIITRNRVLDLHPCTEGWRLVTENGTLTAEHVINAAGLWARKLGRMAGVELPVIPMQHHYLITEDVPEIAGLGREIASATDLEGFTYMQPNQKGVLLGVYEQNPRHWSPDGAPWDYGMDLLPPDIDRIAPELEIGFRRFPALQNVGIKRWVNGAFTFTPDGNPLVGPVPGLRNYWAACGCMGGFSQGGAIGLTLANWMVHGEPGHDIFGMDVARFGAFAAEDVYLKALTAQFYARRFVMSYPNEHLPAGRPLKTSPVHGDLAAEGARFTVNWGMETPDYFAPGEPDFAETGTLRRSNAHRLVAAEVKAVRQRAGMFDMSTYARYEVTGAGAEAWLDQLLACKLPRVGRIKLAPMLAHSGKLMGDLTVSRLGDDRFLLVASYYLQEWHMRWFNATLPAQGVGIRNITHEWTGFALSGPASAAIVQTFANGFALPFFACAEADLGFSPAIIGRLSLTGAHGYEILVPWARQPALYRALCAAGATSIGNRALDSLRLEKSYGIWSREFTQDVTPAMCGLDKFIDFTKAGFTGRNAALKDQPAQRLIAIVIEAQGADATGHEPVWCGDFLSGQVTSGAFGHHTGKSLALAYVRAEHLDSSGVFSVEIAGERRLAHVLREAAHDPRATLTRAP